MKNIDIDFDRKRRTGCPEVVYCEGKSPEQILQIIRDFHSINQPAMGTRLSPDKADILQHQVEKWEYDPAGKFFIAGDPPPLDKRGKPLIVTAGTSDEYAARECLGTLRFFGFNAEQVCDCGVAGVHRLLAHREKIEAADVVIAVAGMEGALPGVVAGLTESPVIAVPTSVGYGVNLGGLSTLFTMLTSCAGGIGVVNIDNGFGAAVLAAKILALLNRKEAD